MTGRRPEPDDDATTHERPSSFRELIYRDRRLVSRRKMDRMIRDRAAEREEAARAEREYVTAFPAMSRMFSGSPAAEWRAIIAVVVLVIGAFLFGRWVGQQDDPEPQSAPPVVLETPA